MCENGWNEIGKFILFLILQLVPILHGGRGTGERAARQFVQPPVGMVQPYFGSVNAKSTNQLAAVDFGVTCPYLLNQQLAVEERITSMNNSTLDRPAWLVVINRARQVGRDRVLKLKLADWMLYGSAG